MALWIGLGAVLLSVGIFWVVIAREPGPSPVDVAIGYEAAWDRLDFSTLFDLSGDELRDGMNREGFVAAQKAAFTPSGAPRHVDRIEIERNRASGDAAHVVTALHSEGAVVQNDLVLRRRSGRWFVTSYGIRLGPAER
jgi:hypothetical protein